jgi:hypothetical protein
VKRRWDFFTWRCCFVQDLFCIVVIRVTRCACEKVAQFISFHFNSPIICASFSHKQSPDRQNLPNLVTLVVMLIEEKLRPNLPGSRIYLSKKNNCALEQRYYFSLSCNHMNILSQLKQRWEVLPKSFSPWQDWNCRPSVTGSLAKPPLRSVFYTQERTLFPRLSPSKDPLFTPPFSQMVESVR